MNWSKTNQDMAGTGAAMIRATRKALSEARRHNELVPVWRNGQVAWVHPDEVQVSETAKNESTRQKNP